MFGEWTPPEQYWRIRFYPAGGLYTTVTDLSHFLIAHMNDGIYNGTRILKKETVELMHATQPGNQIGYGLAWMHETIGGSAQVMVGISPGSIHGCSIIRQRTSVSSISPMEIQDYGLLPFRGLFTVILILYLLFTKEGTLRGEMQHEFTVSSSDLFFGTPLIIPQSTAYENHNN